uniref:Methyltransferase like 21E, pseudo n=1 Tax=Laticauda laticaudata TaxID=8630 RepID=A0A8C5S939_LATLA
QGVGVWLPWLWKKLGKGTVWLCIQRKTQDHPLFILGHAGRNGEGSNALVLCYFLETNVKLCNLVDKNVVEIGAGTGLVSIVASLLGAHVVSTDLPEVLGNLQYNLLRNTKLKCKHEPQVKALVWGVDLEKNFPRSTSQFDYILAADVVYNHPYLEELLLTFDHLCMDNTTIIWAMRFRLESENWFVDQFKKLFHLEMISDFPSLNITLFRAKRRHQNKSNECILPIGY